MAPSSLHSPDEAVEDLPLDSSEADIPVDTPEVPAADAPASPAEPAEEASDAAPADLAEPNDAPEAAPAAADEPAGDDAPVVAEDASSEDTPVEDGALEDTPDDVEVDATEDDSAEDEGERVDEALEETVAAATIEAPPLRYFSAGGRVYLRIGPSETPEGLRLSLITTSLPDGPLWLSFEERPPTPELVNAISAVLVEVIQRTPAGVRCGQETLIAGAAASMGLPVEVPPARSAEDASRRKVMVVERTLRSGAAVRFKGDVLVYGDVNAGAQIEADGNIIVLGALRGLAHAGRSGDESALIISFDLRPTQIRIGRRIAFPPAQPRGRSSLPEVARVRDGEIVLQDFRGRISL